MPSVASISAAPACSNGQSGAIAFFRWKRREREVVLLFWPITHGWRACWGRKESAVVSSALSCLLQEQSLHGKEILCNTNSKSQQHPWDSSAAASDTWLCWKFCHVYVPQKVTLFSSPFHTQNLPLYEYQKWLPDVGQQLTLYPHTDFLILWKPKNLLYGTANFPAEHCSGVDNKPLDRQCCWFQPQTTVAASGVPTRDRSNSYV